MLSLCNSRSSALASILSRAYFGPVTQTARPSALRWNNPNLRNNLQGLLGRDKPSSTAWVRDQGLEEVRRAMLHSLMGLTGCEVARMNMRLRYAGDIEALWYLRSDLLDTLTLLRGEAIAQTVLDRITPMFQGQLPLSLRVPQMPRAPRAHL